MGVDLGILSEELHSPTIRGRTTGGRAGEPEGQVPLHPAYRR